MLYYGPVTAFTAAAPHDTTGSTLQMRFRRPELLMRETMPNAFLSLLILSIVMLPLRGDFRQCDFTKCICKRALPPILDAHSMKERTG